MTRNPARLRARPANVALSDAAQAGLHPLRLDGARDGLLYVPHSCSGSTPAPLVLSLHGAGGRAQHGIELLQRLADSSGFVVLAPDSRARTWDVITRGYGPDISFIDRALTETFRRCRISPTGIAIGGFSDGASYALSVGLANGELFRAVLAYSPGFAAPPVVEGDPEIFISHGTRDDVLPIDRCSRRIVQELRRGRRRVTFREFDGAHELPPAVAAEGVELFLKDIQACAG